MGPVWGEVVNVVRFWDEDVFEHDLVEEFVGFDGSVDVAMGRGDEDRNKKIT